MSLDKDRRQKSGQPELPLAGQGEALHRWRSDESTSAADGHQRSGSDDRLDMEAVVQRDNLLAALHRVQSNRGSPGVDGMTVEQLPSYLRANWPRLKTELIAGSYRPKPVLRREIPKAGGGTRQLGIPTVLDRFIQQAILQVLQPRFDATFSDHSYGFRPGRSAHMAVMAAKRFVTAGRTVVVDVDLEKFFDRVNHDVLMGKLAHRIEDRRLLGLIRRYLEAGVMADGVVIERQEGSPQGGPLSPLLANVLLDEVDRELEQRGHAFARYADDLNVYVGSMRAGERVMRLLRKLFYRLRLRINEAKSAVAPARERKFLGFSFWRHRDDAKLRVAPQAIEKLKERIRKLTLRTRGRSMATIVAELREYLIGWRNYFGLAETPGVFRKLDQWVRHRLRAYQLHLWRHPRVVFDELVRRGVFRSWARLAANFATSWWRCSCSKAVSIALPARTFDANGIAAIEHVTSTLRTAGCGPACPVVWQGTPTGVSYADRARLLLRSAPRLGVWVKCGPGGEGEIAARSTTSGHLTRLEGGRHPDI